ncbi:MAG: UvrD-helicase domain-containing protein [Bacteriovoracaceae bacterium]|nr:UvrD-helicase domain-containing protein [Bacteriovoracaceae bacterium]
MFSLNELNPEQRTAAQTIEGPVLILAGAGSGKTKTVTFRIAHMVRNLGIPAEQILAVSFTNKAAKEMKERTEKILGRHAARGLTLSTFHSLGIQILKEDIVKLGYQRNFTIYDTNDQMAIIREGLKNLRTDKKSFDKKAIQSKISLLKNNGIEVGDFKRSRFFDPLSEYDLVTEHIYQFYQERLHFYNAIDFDDILLLVVKLFRKFPEVATKYSERFRYLMIDEYQDTNGLQFELVKGLTSAHQNICVVGDDDQSIYAFRGADITNILNFEKIFQNTKIIKLEQNYRSTPAILGLANPIIKNSRNRKDKTMFSRQAPGEKPLLWLTLDSTHEAQIVVEDIINYQKEGRPLNEVAILYRSNMQAPVLEDQLRLSMVPYRMIGGQKLYDKKEVKDIISYLSVIRNPNDQISLRRIINIPNRGIGTATLAKILDLTQQKKVTFLKAMNELGQQDDTKFKNFDKLIYHYQNQFKTQPLHTALKELIAEIDYYSFIDKSYDSAQQAGFRKLDIEHLILSAERFVNRFQSDATLENFLEKILLADSQDNKNEHEEEKKNEITMMTLHSSKGLEFNRVYLVGVEEEILPHKKSIDDGDVDEERRLCYVGVTRAKHNLIMTCTKQRVLYGKTVPRNRSRFLVEISKDLYTEQDRTTFGHMSAEEAQEYKTNFFSDLIKNI